MKTIDDLIAHLQNYIDGYQEHIDAGKTLSTLDKNLMCIQQINIGYLQTIKANMDTEK